MAAEKILVFTKNWFGDVIMQTPCFRILKENFPGSRLIAALPGRTSWILKDHPSVDGLIAFDEQNEDSSLAAKIRFVRKLRREKFSRVYLLHRSRTRTFLSWLAGIPVRVGYNTKGRGFWLTQSISEPREAMHQTDYFAALLKSSGLNVPENYYSEFYFSGEDQRQVEELWQKLIPTGTCRIVALNPGANWEPKRWPTEYFARLADLLAERPGIQFVITGAEKDVPLAQDIFHQSRKAKPIVLAGKTSLGQLGAFLSRCDVMVTADSGPMHIASSVGTPVVALFGPTDSGDTGPRGRSPALILEERANGKTDPQMLMRAIMPEKVAKAIEEMGWLS